MSRSPLAISAAGGSFATLALQLLRDSWGFDLPVDRHSLFDQTLCGCPIHLLPPLGHWHILVLGICIGLLLGPVVDTISLLRQLWSAFLRRQVSNFRAGALYRVLE